MCPRTPSTLRTAPSGAPFSFLLANQARTHHGRLTNKLEESESLGVTIGRDNVWPIRERGAAYDADTFLDVIEALHDLIAKPLDGWHHDFGGCGMHWHTFDRRAGADEFRAQLNPLLARYEMPLELSATGEVVALAPEGRARTLNLANGFAIRHNTNSRCDQIIVLRLKERESKAAAVQQA